MNAISILLLAITAVSARDVRYELKEISTKWGRATKLCNRYYDGGRLAELRSPQDVQAMRDSLGGKTEFAAWIALRNEGKGWMWQQGVQPGKKKVCYAPWGRRVEPPTSGGCGIVRVQGRHQYTYVARQEKCWHGWFQHFSLRILCEFDGKPEKKSWTLPSKCVHEVQMRTGQCGLQKNQCLCRHHPEYYSKSKSRHYSAVCVDGDGSLKFQRFDDTTELAPAITLHNNHGNVADHYDYWWGHGGPVALSKESQLVWHGWPCPKVHGRVDCCPGGDCGWLELTWERSEDKYGWTAFFGVVYPNKDKSITVHNQVKESFKI